MAVINGTRRNDTLRGTSGADTISGLGGNDTINPGFGPDRIDGGTGNDTVVFTGVMSSSPVPPDGLIVGGKGFDTIDLRVIGTFDVSMVDNVVYVTVGNQRFRTDGIEEFRFGSSNDFITPDLFYAGANVDFRGGAGNDYLSGSGNYGLYGEAGDDDIVLAGSFATATSGTLDGGVGTDELIMLNSTSVDLAAGTAQAGKASYTVAGFERIAAYLDSVVLGSKGDDIVFVNDLFDGEDGAARFEGRDGDDSLSGSQGGDTIDGGEGEDRITGGQGADTLTGGSGRDLFIYRNDDSPDFNSDVITDFAQGEDRIDLSQVDANTRTGALDAFEFIGKRGFSREAGELRYITVGRTTLIQGDTDGDGDADLMIQLDGRFKLKGSDFLLTARAEGADLIDPSGAAHHAFAPSHATDHLV